VPPVSVVFYADPGSGTPVLDWLAPLPKKARLKCTVRIKRLRELGHSIRRPEADYLRDGIHELRTRLGHVNYRILYGFHDGTAILLHGLTKEARVPAKAIELARQRLGRFGAHPKRHTYRS
jgi:phage-related protein